MLIFVFYLLLLPSLICALLPGAKAYNPAAPVAPVAPDAARASAASSAADCIVMSGERSGNDRDHDGQG